MKGNASVIVLLMCLLMAACGKTPRGIIDEDDMSGIMADLLLGDSYINLNGADFPNDSTRQALKQSIVERHGYTMRDYDSSLVWYAHNMEVYKDVLDRTVERLEKSGANIPDDVPQGAQQQGPKRYPTVGDTADLWADAERTLVVAPTRGDLTYFNFETLDDKQPETGDRYELIFKYLTQNCRLVVMLAADYPNGTTQYMTRTTNYNGWTHIALQTDSVDKPRRVYGYIAYGSDAPVSIGYIDSLCILRTRLNREQYNYINTHRRAVRQP